MVITHWLSTRPTFLPHQAQSSSVILIGSSLQNRHSATADLHGAPPDSGILGVGLKLLSPVEAI